MALPSNTFTQYDLTNTNREDLSDVIYNISPMETPFSSGIPRTKATHVLHEWQTDSLAAASSTNASLEGDDATGATMVAPSRVNNRCQILQKTVVISGTQKAMNPAGMSGAFNYYTAKSGKEVKRDVEAALLSINPSTAGSTATARLLGGIETWLSTNKVQAATSTTPGSGATIVVGTAVACTAAQLKALLDTVIQQCWTQGGDPKVIMVAGGGRQTISGMTGIATNFNSVNQGQQAQIVGGADVYVSSFGRHMIVANRFMVATTALVLDMEYWALAELRGFQSTPLSITGDNQKIQILTECTLVARNEAASGKVSDRTFA